MSGTPPVLHSQCSLYRLLIRDVSVKPPSSYISNPPELHYYWVLHGCCMPCNRRVRDGFWAHRCRNRPKAQSAFFCFHPSRSPCVSPCATFRPALRNEARGQLKWLKFSKKVCTCYETQFGTLLSLLLPQCLTAKLRCGYIRVYDGL